ncbi:MAG: DUF4199 domain-containing protein [Holophaga sp.]|nr:DUF4199 domain-containing protein [Holophaga sp.]
MNPTLTAGLLLGILVSAWSFIWVSVGWHRDPATFPLFWMVMPIQIVVVIWGLRKTAPHTGYGRQVVLGVAISVLGSLIIFGGSLLLTTVVFPSYFQDLERIGRMKMAQDGLNLARIDELIRAQAPWQKPLPAAFSGVFGTWVTGLLTSLIAAVWLRRKG